MVNIPKISETLSCLSVQKFLEQRFWGCHCYPAHHHSHFCLSLALWHRGQRHQTLNRFSGAYIPLPSRYDQPIATLLVLIVILGLCFLVGLFIRTRLGLYLYSGLESSLLSKTPGYKMIKETVNQFFGKKVSPFSSVALIQIFQNETLVTGFVTDKHAGDMVSVFVPTGPNPTSGFIYHLQYV